MFATGPFQVSSRRSAGPSGTSDKRRCSESWASVFTQRPGGWKPPLRNGCSSGFKPLAGADNGSLFTRTCVTAAGTETCSNFVMAARGKPKFTLRSSPLFSASISTSSVTTWLPGFSTRTTSPSSPEPAATEPPPPAANNSGSSPSSIVTATGHDRCPPSVTVVRA